MSMLHKAFVFDYHSFSSQLYEVIVDSLKNNNKEILVYFIQQNIQDVKDPYEGSPIDSSWQTMIEVGDVQEYADFALTKFYDPGEDIGLDYEWQDVEKILNEEFLIDSHIILLGSGICFSNNFFDPGRMGSYFQSFGEVQENFKTIKKCLEQKPEFSNKLQKLISLFQKAISLNHGLYITF